MIECVYSLLRWHWYKTYVLIRYKNGQVSRAEGCFLNELSISNLK